MDGGGGGKNAEEESSGAQSEREEDDLCKIHTECLKCDLGNLYLCIYVCVCVFLFSAPSPCTSYLEPRYL